MMARSSAAERTIPLSHAGIEEQRKRYKAQKVRWRMHRCSDGSRVEPWTCSSTGATLETLPGGRWRLTKVGAIVTDFDSMLDAVIEGEKP